MAYYAIVSDQRVANALVRMASCCKLADDPQRNRMSTNREDQVDQLIRELVICESNCDSKAQNPQETSLSTLLAMTRVGEILQLAWLLGQLDNTTFYVECGQWFNWAASVDDEASLRRAGADCTAVNSVLNKLNEVWHLCGAAWDAALDLKTTRFGADDALLLRRSLFNYHALPPQDRYKHPDIRMLLESTCHPVSVNASVLAY